MTTPVHQIALIVAIVWVAHMALFLPLMLVVGRAAQRADVHAAQDHRDLLYAAAAPEHASYALERTKKPNRRAAS